VREDRRYGDVEPGADDARLQLRRPGAAEVHGQLLLGDGPHRLGVDQEAVHVEEQGRRELLRRGAARHLALK
jgi:hypothetical protein